MKNYQEFIKEAELSKTEGVPEDWIRKTDVKAQRELGVRKDEPTKQVPPGLRPPPGMPPLPPGTELPGPETMYLVGKINKLVQNVMPIFNKHDKDEVYQKMTEIAIEAVKSEFPNVLDNVTLDVKMVDLGRVAEEMPEIKETPKDPKSEEEQKKKIESEEESENDESSENDSNETPIDDFLRSPELKKEIDKVKLMNAISQGEGLNTKMILHSDIVKDGLKEIFGDDWQIVFNTYDEMSKIHLQLNWVQSIDFTAKDMAGMPEGVAGTVQVGWDDDNEEDDNEQMQSAEDILKSIEQGESLSDMSDEISDQLEGGRGKITVRAVDLGMLIHEIVKGIYQLVVVSGMQVMKDERTKMAAKMATDSFADEAEEFRYGPYIAAALRDVVNKCEGSDKYPNARLYVFGLMVQMDAQPFLDLMLEILKESDSATEMVQSLVDQVNEMFDEYQQKEVEYDLDTDEDDNILPSRSGESEYKDMSQSELKDLVDMYLDSGEFEEIEKIRPYLKESIDMRIYFEKQVQKIKESKK